MWTRALDIALGKVVQIGLLTVELPSGTVLTFGDGKGPQAHVSLKDSATVRHMVINPELAVGESYMNGTLVIENDDIHGFLELILRNLDEPHWAWWQRVHVKLRTTLRRFMQHNAGRMSVSNVAHHYDLSGELYELFLDTDRQYSCAYFRSPDDTLEAAQEQKKAHIAQKLRIEPGMRVLDIGCGWGGMGLTLARNHGAQVLGITLSREQLAVAQERARAEGLEKQVEFRMADYRELSGQFDRIVSVGMFEHVGLPYFDAYFRSVHDLLACDGVALIHSIGISEAPCGTNPWIAKYIFPGGYVPSLSEIAASIERQNLWIADIESLRLHYAYTLRHWFDRFVANADKVIELYDERFVRMWKFYLAACEQTFRFRRQGVFQFQISREVDAVPITRDYLYSGTADEELRAAE